MSERTRTGQRRKTKQECDLCRRPPSAWPQGKSEHEPHHRAGRRLSAERSNLPFVSVSHWLRSGEQWGDIASRARWLLFGRRQFSGEGDSWEALAAFTPCSWVSGAPAWREFEQAPTNTFPWSRLVESGVPPRIGSICQWIGPTVCLNVP